jgi:wyosine [tRNA(Phe)-imidazoG37] synthetase (radical SAM superfamily)
MAGFLFDDMIFGPVHSRRLGKSLGINLLPTHSKACSYNCIYCECGWTGNRRGMNIELPGRVDIASALEEALLRLRGTEMQPDSLTFAGNGEPTMHPEFDGIIEDTIGLRDKLLPSAKVSVLSNGSMLQNPRVFAALLKVDNNIQKLDGGTEETIRMINMPLKAFRLAEYVESLKRFGKNLVIQSLFLRGRLGQRVVDNTSPEEVQAWLNLVKDINPAYVMIYAIERETPASELIRIGKDELEAIATLVRNAGLEAEVYA